MPLCFAVVAVLLHPCFRFNTEGVQTGAWSKPLSPQALALSVPGTGIPALLNLALHRPRGKRSQSPRSLSTRSAK